MDTIWGQVGHQWVTAIEPGCPQLHNFELHKVNSTYFASWNWEIGNGQLNGHGYVNEVSLSGKPLISVSWRSISGILSCSFVWNIFFCFVFVVVVLFHFLWLSGLVSVRTSLVFTRMEMSFLTQLGLGSWLSLALCDDPNGFFVLSGSQSWGYAKTCFDVVFCLFTPCVEVAQPVPGFLSEGITPYVAVYLECP